MKDRIRQQMIKHPNHLLWNKDLNKWDKFDLEIFEKLVNIETKPTTKEKVQRHTTRPKQVKRLLDGKIYTSVQQCMKDNNLGSTLMYRYINTNQHFTRL
jgi:hypothetical protein